MLYITCYLVNVIDLGADKRCVHGHSGTPCVHLVCPKKGTLKIWEKVKFLEKVTFKTTSE